MNELEIKSSNSNAKLILSDFDKESFLITCENKNLKFSLKIWAYEDIPLLINLFKYMKESWENWIEPIKWQSIEEELILKFEKDKSGHIIINVEINKYLDTTEPWYIKFQVITEVGLLKNYYRDIKEIYELINK